MKELQNGDAKTDEDESAQGSNEQQPFLGFAGTVETDEDTCNIKEKQLQLIAQEERTAFAASAFGTPTRWHDRFAHMLQMPTLKHIARDN